MNSVIEKVFRAKVSRGNDDYYYTYDIYGPMDYVGGKDYPYNSKLRTYRDPIINISMRESDFKHFDRMMDEIFSPNSYGPDRWRGGGEELFRRFLDDQRRQEQFEAAMREEYPLVQEAWERYQQALAFVK